MSNSTLHLKAGRLSTVCAVCGADLVRAPLGWWLANTWTADARYRQASGRGCDVVHALQAPAGVSP